MFRWARTEGVIELHCLNACRISRAARGRIGTEAARLDAESRAAAAESEAQSCANWYSV